MVTFLSFSLYLHGHHISYDLCNDHDTGQLVTYPINEELHALITLVESNFLLYTCEECSINKM